jgi:hypothetical protein
MKSNLHVELYAKHSIFIANEDYNLWGRDSDLNTWTPWDRLFFRIVDGMYSSPFEGTLITIGGSEGELYKEFPPFKVCSPIAQSFWNSKSKILLSSPHILDNWFWNQFTTSFEYQLNGLLICDQNIQEEEYLVKSTFMVLSWYGQWAKDNSFPPPEFPIGNWIWPRISSNLGELLMFLQPQQFDFVKGLLLDYEVTQDWEIEIIAH